MHISQIIFLLLLFYSIHWGVWQHLIFFAVPAVFLLYLHMLKVKSEIAQKFATILFSFYSKKENR